MIQGIVIGLGLAMIGVAIAWAATRLMPSRDAVRLWWQTGLAEPPASIAYRDGNAVAEGTPRRACGLHLMVETAKGMRAISAGDAVDREAFWKAWKYLGGKPTGWIDEDGDEWQPG